MIVVEISGGLGNQMFQYAFGRALACRSGSNVLFAPPLKKPRTYRRFQLPTVFSLEVPAAAASDLKRILGWQRHGLVRHVLRRMGPRARLSPRYIEEPHFHFSPRMLEVGDDVYLSGYWQSEKYFVDAAEAIRNDFAFRPPLSELNRAVARDIEIAGESAVSVHVRRGDYVTDAATNRIHGTCGRSYYASAVEYLAARVPKARFYIFSDDMAWVRANLDLHCSHLLIDHNRGKDDWEDMRLMSLCRHHIIANSTFSWWGAWLNPRPEKIVVAPRKWFAVERELGDLLPPGWVSL